MNGFDWMAQRNCHWDFAVNFALWLNRYYIYSIEIDLNPFNLDALFPGIVCLCVEYPDVPVDLHVCNSHTSSTLVPRA